MSAADFLFTPSVQRVLGRLFSEPENNFTLNQLLTLAGGGRGSSQRQIESLLSAGVLREEARRARQRSISVNTAYFMYPELRSIVLKTFGLAEPLRIALKPFQSKIEEAFIFGSVAKGSDTHQSDIDLIVVGNVKLLPLTEAILHTEESLGRPIHLNLYTVEEWARLKRSDPVLAQISNGTAIRLLPHDATG
jgi:predicted nucleotidyltransferase